MSLPSHSPPRLTRPKQGNSSSSSFLSNLANIIFVIVILIVIAFATAALYQAFISPSRTEFSRVNTYVKTTCNVEGFPDYTVYQDNQDHWRGFCLNADTAYEIPMHPDLNLIQQR